MVSWDERVAREASRVAALHEYGVLDQPADDELSDVVRAAAVLAGVPNATLNLIDERRQCQLTTVGFEGADSARSDSMCALHFEDGVTVVVADASRDERYRANPWVDGRLAAVRFYASAPLISPEGHALGSLCVFDVEPGGLEAVQIATLEGLARVLVALFERRRQARLAVEHAAEAVAQRAIAEEQRAIAQEQQDLAQLVVAESERRGELTGAVLDSAQAGIVVAGPDGRLLMFNDTARAWHGLDADAGLDPDQHAGAYDLYAADGCTPLPLDAVPLRRVLRGGRVEGAEVVIARSGHPPVSVLCSGRLMSGADGALLGAVVVMHDVTVQRAREVALAEAHTQLAAAHAQLSAHAAQVQALARASQAVASADDPRQAICASMQELAGADAAYLMQPDGAGHLVSTAAVGLGADVVLRLDLLEDVSLPLSAWTAREQLFVADVAAHPDANPVMIRSSGTVSGVWQPVLLPGGACTGVLGVIWRSRVAALPATVGAMLHTLAGEAAHAIERADLLDRLAHAARHDALTGLVNRRRWDEVAHAEIARAARSGAGLTFVLVDLDHFKRYNDSRGHLAGDELLRGFAAAAATGLREVDTLARWGGEEFVLALPGCSAAEAVAVADRIRAAVPDGQTCTVGVAQWRPGETPADVLGRADAALYEGKQSGRDTTVVDPGSALRSPAAG